MVEVYWTDAEGQRWRIYDTSYHEHRNTIHPPDDLQAKTRIFVPRKGPKRIHTFAKGSREHSRTNTLPHHPDACHGSRRCIVSTTTLVTTGAAPDATSIDTACRN